MAHFRAAADLAYLDMLRELQPSNVYAKSTTALFSGFPVALLALGVIAGAIVVALLWKCCIRGIAFGKRAFSGHRTYHGLRMRDIVERDARGQQVHTSRMVPVYEEERRSRTKDVVHVVTIVGFWGIIAFGIYAAFQVCGIDPALLVALGAGTIVLTYSVAPFVQKVVAALEVFTGGMIQEDDDVFVWAVGKSMRVYWMGTTYFIGEQIDDEGGLIEHTLSYTTLLNPGFSRFVDNGAQHTMGKVYNDWKLQQQQPRDEAVPAKPSSVDVIASLMGTTPPPRQPYDPYGTGMFNQVILKQE